jgi:hypothetical protein
MRDTIGISGSKTKLSKMNLKEAKIAGVVCSSNKLKG